MTGARIILVWSEQEHDRGWIDRLKDHLRPFEQGAGLNWWDADRIDAGDDREATYQQAMQAARVAVVMVTAKLLATDHLAKGLLGPLVDRAQAGTLTLLPVYLMPTVVDEVRMGRLGLPLTTFEGIGRHDKPLATLDWSTAERQLVELAKRLHRLTAVPGLPGAHPAPETPASSTHRLAIASDPATELTIELRRQGASLVAEYYGPAASALSRIERPWSEVAHVEAITTILDTAGPRALAAQLGRLSETWGLWLFDLLFGPEEQWQPLLRAIVQRPEGTSPGPLAASLAVRICTHDPILASLPWRLTRWKQWRLAAEGWTFVVTGARTAQWSVSVPAPAHVCILAPQTAPHGRTARPPEHVEALRGLLAQAWHDQDRKFSLVATTRKQLTYALRGNDLSLLYIYAHVVPAQGKPALLIAGPAGEGDMLPLHELAGELQALRRPPDVVYFDLDGTGLDPGALRAPMGSDWSRLPLVVYPRLMEPSADAGRHALQWLSAWLAHPGHPVDPSRPVDSGHPVDALHKLAAHDHAGVEAATTVVVSNLRSWSSQRFDPQSHPPAIHLEFDRGEPKGTVLKELGPLVRRSDRRVLVLVAYAAPGNRLELLSETLATYLDSEAQHYATLLRHKVEFPLALDDLATTLPHQLREALDHQPDESDKAMLQRTVPLSLADPQTPVLWLDWGTFGDPPHHQRKLGLNSLRNWMDYCVGHLAAACPSRVRVVSFLAVEADPAKHAKLATAFDDQEAGLHPSRASFLLVSVHPTVKEKDVRHLLDDPRRACLPAHQRELARLVIARTAGRYEDACALLEEGQQQGWDTLLFRLRRETSQAVAGVEEDDL